ncbi:MULTISPECIES: response regulator transcription factor [unclassified Bradyrhizobium]|uniref:response regulator transcription factor n=1 Tax=unclassified Bradyrhizobium TaxID=2631580 RepID=UPI0028E921B5|nr:MULTISPECIES: response regulator transcription factor [unclassified Bradyrhizobium]
MDGRFEEVQPLVAASLPRHHTLAIVDPHQVVRLGIKSLLAVKANFRMIAEHGDIRSGLTCIEVSRPEIVITDVVGWSLEGFEWIRRLLEAAPCSRIVVYSASAEERHVIAALAGGASAYILKQGDGQMLLRAVDAAIQGHMVLDNGVTPTVLRRIRSETVPLDRSALVDLTQQETRIVALLAEGHPNREIASRLDLSAKTVRNYVSQILTKLNLQTRTQVAAYAIRHGIEQRRSESDKRTGHNKPDTAAVGFKRPDAIPDLSAKHTRSG